MESLGIQNLKEIVDFTASAGELIAGLSDGLGVNDLGAALSAAKKAPAALKDAGQAWSEYCAMSDSDAAELENFAVTEFDIADDKVEAFIEQCFKAAVELHALVGLFKKPSA